MWFQLCFLIENSLKIVIKVYFIKFFRKNYYQDIIFVACFRAKMTTVPRLRAYVLEKHHLIYCPVETSERESVLGKGDK